MTFQLTEKQREANRLLAGPASNIMLRGGSRSGKTLLLTRAICIRAMKAPESRHAIFRYRFNHARASIWKDTLPKVMRLCFPGVPLKTNETDLEAMFPNGSIVALAGLDDKARVEKVLGTEYATLYFNESSQIPWTSVETAMSRLAQKTPLALKAYFDCNPPSKLHWSHQLFREHLKPGTREKLPNPADYAEMKINPSDNRDNLPAKYFDILAGMSAAQRLRFEAGEWASEVNGALWTLEGIDRTRVSDAPPMQRIVVAVDPSGTKGDGGGDDIGIVAAGRGRDGRGYVLEDASLQAGPEQWARAVVGAYRRWNADRIVVERNFGGAMASAVIRAVDPTVPITEVVASRGKIVRAEPISALYETGKVSHVGTWPDLEDQLANMTPAGFMGDGSPDRADALVWAMTELMTGSTYSLDAL